MLAPSPTPVTRRHMTEPSGRAAAVAWMSETTISLSCLKVCPHTVSFLCLACRDSEQLRSPGSCSLLDRARILYNHIFFSDLPEGYKVSLLEDRFYLDVLKHRNFNPRLVEWLSKISNVRSVRASKYRLEVTRVLDNPEQLWQIAF